MKIKKSELKEIIKEELSELKEKYGDERRTEIRHADGDISIEDMIPDEEVVVATNDMNLLIHARLNGLNAEFRKAVRKRDGNKDRITFS